MRIFSFSLFLMIISPVLTSAQKETLVQKAARIHNAVFTIDTHCDTPLNIFRSDFNLAVRHNAKESDTKVDFPRMKEGGLDAQFFAAFLSQGSRTIAGHANANKKAFDIIQSIYKSVEAAPGLAQIATTPEDGYAIEKAGKRASISGLKTAMQLATICQ